VFAALYACHPIAGPFQSHVWKGQRITQRRMLEGMFDFLDKHSVLMISSMPQKFYVSF
jgi:hypothetical protein